MLHYHLGTDHWPTCQTANLRNIEAHKKKPSLYLCQWCQFLPSDFFSHSLQVFHKKPCWWSGSFSSFSELPLSSQVISDYHQHYLLASFPVLLSAYTQRTKSYFFDFLSLFSTRQKPSLDSSRNLKGVYCHFFVVLPIEKKQKRER